MSDFESDDEVYRSVLVEVNVAVNVYVPGGNVTLFDTVPPLELIIVGPPVICSVPLAVGGLTVAWMLTVSPAGVTAPLGCTLSVVVVVIGVVG